MAEHVRKYDDWNIERPTGGPSAGAQQAPVSDPAAPLSNPDPVVHNPLPDQSVTAEPTQTGDASFFEPGEAISNPFLADSPSLVENPAVQGTGVFPADDQPGTPQPSGDMIDPDTGLPIPDYMKPFIQGN